MVAAWPPSKVTRPKNLFGLGRPWVKIPQAGELKLQLDLSETGPLSLFQRKRSAGLCHRHRPTMADDRPM